MIFIKHFVAIGILTLSIFLNFPMIATAGDPRPPISEFFSINTLNEFLTRIALVSLRGTLDFTYQDVSNDPYINRMVLNNAIFRPQSRWDHAKDCEIKVERLTTSSSPLGDLNILRSRIEANGIAVPFTCLPPEFSGIASGIGNSGLDIDKLYLNVEYQMNTSSLTANAIISIPKIAAITTDLKFSYIGVSANNGSFFLDLAQASFALEDLGLWGLIKNKIAPEMANPKAVSQMVADMCRALYPRFKTGSDKMARPGLNHSQAACFRSANKEINNFLTGSGKLVLRTVLKKPIRIDSYFDPEKFFHEVRPVFSSGTNLRYKIISADLLNKAIRLPYSLSDAEKLSVGSALVTGKGAPRSLLKGQALLRPLADKGHKLAAMILAKSKSSIDPESAYKYAMVSGKAGNIEALSLMDRLEKVLTTPQVLKIQAEYASKSSFRRNSQEGFVPIIKIRSRAQSYLRGRGVFRSYAKAYHWALLGDATGDLSSAGIAEEIKTRMRYRGQDAAAAWNEVSEKIQSKVLDSWIEYNYPSKIAK